MSTAQLRPGSTPPTPPSTESDTPTGPHLPLLRVCTLASVHTPASPPLAKSGPCAQGVGACRRPGSEWISAPATCSGPCHSPGPCACPRTYNLLCPESDCLQQTPPYALRTEPSRTSPLPRNLQVNGTAPPTSFTTCVSPALRMGPAVGQETDQWMDKWVQCPVHTHSQTRGEAVTSTCLDRRSEPG